MLIKMKQRSIARLLKMLSEMLTVYDSVCDRQNLNSPKVLFTGGRMSLILVAANLVIPRSISLQEGMQDALRKTGL